jgi:hypothetical protein
VIFGTHDWPDVRDPFALDQQASIDARVGPRSSARSTGNAVGSEPAWRRGTSETTDFSNLPFGRENTWRGQPDAFSQNLYSGRCRNGAQLAIADAGRDCRHAAADDDPRGQLVPGRRDARTTTSR